MVHEKKNDDVWIRFVREMWLDGIFELETTFDDNAEASYLLIFMPSPGGLGDECK